MKAVLLVCCVVKALLSVWSVVNYVIVDVLWREEDAVYIESCEVVLLV